jgi:hypothetical protein
MRTKLIVAALIILIVPALLIARLVFAEIVSYLSYNKYEDQIEVASPDSRYIAAGYHIVGGATTTDSTVVLIRSKDELLDYDKNSLLFIVDNLGPFHLFWKNNNVLIIKYTPGPIYTQEFRWKDVGIRYIAQQ